MQDKLHSSASSGDYRHSVLPKRSSQSRLAVASLLSYAPQEPHLSSYSTDSPPQPRTIEPNSVPSWAVVHHAQQPAAAVTVSPAVKADPLQHVPSHSPQGHGTHLPSSPGRSNPASTPYNGHRGAVGAAQASHGYSSSGCRHQPYPQPGPPPVAQHRVPTPLPPPRPQVQPAQVLPAHHVRTAMAYSLVPLLEHQIPKRRRRTQACNYCRLKKSRCGSSILIDGTVRCANCVKENLECVWRESKKRGPKPKLPAASSKRSAAKETKAQSKSDKHVGSQSSSTGSRGIQHSAALQRVLAAAQTDNSGKNGKQAAAKAVASSAADISNLISAENSVGFASIPETDDSHSSTEDSASERTTPLQLATEQAPTRPTAVRSYGVSGPIPTIDIVDQLVLDPPRGELKKLGIRPPPIGDLMQEFFSGKVDSATCEAVLTYYTYFYAFCPILQPSSFLRKVLAGKVDPMLMNAIHALSSRFARDGTDRRIETELHVGKVMSRLVMHTGEPTTDIVCAMQITTMCVRGYRGFVPHDTLMCAVANFVLQLGWHRLDDDKDAPPPKTWDEWVDLETKRRAFWMNFQMDSYHVGRSGGAAIFDAEAVRTRMPCPESEWDDLSSWINRAHAHSVFANMNGRDSDSEDGGNSGVSTREALRYRCWTDPASIPAAGSSEESARIVTEQATPSARFDAMQETMLQSFWHRTPHCNLVKKIGKFISGARSSSVNSGSDCKPPRRPRLLSDDPMFSEYSQQLDYMCTLPPAAANLKDPLFNASKASFFGNIEHKKYLLRVRYFSQQLYTFPAVIMLHSSNRPSLFTETDTGLSSVLLDEEEIKISMALQKALGPAWSQGLVAKDIEPRSWRVCVDAAHRLSDVLRLNDDISLRRVDTVAPFCIFSTITVLLRQLRKCKHAMDSNDMSEMPIEEWKNEHTRSLAGIARQWRALQEMGSVWHIGGLAELLKPMHIDEVAKAAEQLSSMSLK